MKKYIVLLGLLFVIHAAMARAADSVDALDGLVRGRGTSRINLDGGHHWYSDSKISGGIKSQNRLGTVNQFGNYVKNREEVFIGARNPRGWGLFASTGFSATARNAAAGPTRGDLAAKQAGGKPHGAGLPQSPTDSGGFGDSPMNRDGMQDASLSLTHPIFDNGETNMSGMIRQSIPISDYARNNHLLNQGYYLNFNVRLKNKYYLSNVLLFHEIEKDTFTPPFDIHFSTGLMSTLSRRVKDWCRVGGGARIQADDHVTGPMGGAAEVFTLADFTISPSVFVGPRVHFPVAAVNSTDPELPNTPSISNISMEFYMQVAL